MPETTSIALLGQAARMLAEADTIQKAKELKYLALTAADFARRKGLGEEAIQYSRSYALEAERRIGQLLRETERAKGGQPYQKSTSTTVAPVEPTLSELGLSKRESAEAQVLAELPAETFEAIKAGQATLLQVKREQREAKREERRLEPGIQACQPGLGPMAVGVPVRPSLRGAGRHQG